MKSILQLQFYILLLPIVLFIKPNFKLYSETFSIISNRAHIGKRR